MVVTKKDLIDYLASVFNRSSEETRQTFEQVIATSAEFLNQEKKIKCAEFASISIGGNDPISESAFAEKIGPQAPPFWNTTFQFIQQKLLEGCQIEIADFASFRIEERKAKIVQDKKTGQKSIAPSRKICLFTPSPSFLKAVGGKPISFIPTSSLQESVSKMKSSGILLAVPERDPFVRTIEYHFTRSGWKVQTATSVKEAQQMLGGNETFLVILDSNLPDSQKLCEYLKCTIETSLIPLIIMYPKGTDIKKTDQFRICGNEHVIQPFEVKTLLSMAETELTRSAEEESVFVQEVLFQFPTEDESIDRANELGSRLFDASGLSDEGQVALCAAFREGIGNAAQHGNKHRRDKLLEVLYLLDKEKITVAVTDMGNGFDHSKYLNQGKSRNALDKARESHRAGKLGGLGIMLMLKCVDRLEYNDKGNVITLTKYINKK